MNALISKRIYLKFLLCNYYDFIEREIIPVDYHMFEKLINNIDYIYIDEKNKIIISIETFFIINRYHEELLSEIRNTLRNFMEEPIEDDSSYWNIGTEESSENLINLGDHYDNIKTLYTCYDYTDEYNNYIKNQIANYEDYKIILLYNRLTNTNTNIFLNNNNSMFFYDRSEILNIDNDEIRDLLSIINNYNIMYKNKHDKILINDIDKFLEDLKKNLRRQNDTKDKTGMIFFREEKICFYLAHYIFTNSVKIDYKIDESLFRRNINKDSISMIINKSGNTDANIIDIYILFTSNMIKMYDNYKEYYDSKISQYRNKKIHILFDKDFMYNPLELNLNPIFEKIDIDSDDVPIVIQEVENLPKLILQKDITARYLGLEKNDIVKITNTHEEKASIQYKVVV